MSKIEFDPGARVGKSPPVVGDGVSRIGLGVGCPDVGGGVVPVEEDWHRQAVSIRVGSEVH